MKISVVFFASAAVLLAACQSNSPLEPTPVPEGASAQAPSSTVTAVSPATVSPTAPAPTAATTAAAGSSQAIAAFSALAAATVAAPTFSPQPQNPPSSVFPLVTMRTTTANATIRYTTNGAQPSASSTKYSAPITVTKTTTLRARAFKDGMTTSATTTATYTIVPTEIRARTKADALGELKSWLIVDWCSSSQAFGLQQMNNANPKGSLLADVLQWFFTTFTPYSAQSAIERELASYSSQSVSQIDARIAALQKKLKTSDLEKAYRNSWCG